MDEAGRGFEEKELVFQWKQANPQRAPCLGRLAFNPQSIEFGAAVHRLDVGDAGGGTDPVGVDAVKRMVDQMGFGCPARQVCEPRQIEPCADLGQ